MKKYHSLGELLTDFRQLNRQTQSDLAAMLGVDVRTVARWEKNESLINPDKLAEVVEQTFIPYQVVHNLNAPIPLPVYYDFKIRKYSLTAVEKEMPEAKWFGARMEVSSVRIRPVSTDQELEYITRYHRFLYPTDKPATLSLIKQATKMLPELNYILYDQAGFYAGHQVVFPLSASTYQKLKNREMVPGDLNETHLKNYKTVKPAIFFNYSTYADCNEHFYYLFGAAIRFMKQFHPDDYIYGALVVRHDSLKLIRQAGLKKIWEDKEEQAKLGMVSPPTFIEGKFNRVFLGE